jgi:hypothetical protein
MGRTYKRKSVRGSYGQESLNKALAAIEQGTPLKTAAKLFDIPAKTLRRHRDKKVLKPGFINLGRFRPEFNKECEEELVKTIQKMEGALFGLSTIDP